MYTGSDGKRYSETMIRRRYAEALKEKHQGNGRPMCEGCDNAQAVDNSHIIAKATCKTLHKTELIWNPDNFFNACRHCHHVWENYKSGEFIHLNNLVHCMLMMRENDPEGFNKRMIVLNELHG